MKKPIAILDPHWRSVGEIFSDSDLDRLHHLVSVVWGKDGPMPADDRDAAMAEARFLITAQPEMSAQDLARAPELQAVIEVSGAFPNTVDYMACDARRVEVLCCAPGFRESVAEMALGMAIGSARGLISQHEAFREGNEDWLADREDDDFSLYGAEVGFVGYGSIAREIHRLLRPFRVRVLAHDPALVSEPGVEFLPLKKLMGRVRCLFVTASPTADNAELISASDIALMPQGARMILISRAHLVDFEAACTASEQGRIHLATDVFQKEPLDKAHPLRSSPNAVLSPHRAAAVKGGRQLIGRMIVDDIASMIAGDAPRNLQRAHGRDMSNLPGGKDVSSVRQMALKR